MRSLCCWSPRVSAWEGVIHEPLGAGERWEAAAGRAGAKGHRGVSRSRRPWRGTGRLTCGGMTFWAGVGWGATRWDVYKLFQTLSLSLALPPGVGQASAPYSSPAGSRPHSKTLTITWALSRSHGPAPGVRPLGKGPGMDVSRSQILRPKQTQAQARFPGEPKEPT